MIKGNRGEWSEIYLLLKLLSDGKVHAGDANLNKLDVYYPILNLIRQESKKFEYTPDYNHNVVFVKGDGTQLATIPLQTIIEESSFLLEAIKRGRNTKNNQEQPAQGVLFHDLPSIDNLQQIEPEKKKNSSDGAFAIPRTERFMQELYCEKLKAKSQDKADIKVVLHDFRTNQDPTLAFSIKSQLGSPSTLLNAGDTTNFTFKVEGDITPELMNTINSIPTHRERMNSFFGNGLSLSFIKVDNPIFCNNLVFIDSCLPTLVSHCLIEYARSSADSSVKSIVHNVAESNPLDVTTNNVTTLYEHKMKQLLLSSALGMVPSTEWNGRFDANGGYLVVKKDGDIVCYHFYNQNDVEDYLFNNTKFENASRTRYGFGKIFQVDNDSNFYLRLNLQIRFKM